MDKRRNHIIFWVGYFVWNGILIFIAANSLIPFQLILLRVILGCGLTLLCFYFLTLFIFPKTLPSKKYFLFILGIFFLTVITTLLHQSVCLTLNIISPLLFPQIKLSMSAIRALLPMSRAVNLAFPFWLLNIFLNNLKQKESSERKLNTLKKVVLNSQLLGLKNQINPHFFYNILNFFYAQSLPFSSKLSYSILKLAEMMRYAIRENNEEEKVSLEQEIDYVKNYIELENSYISDECVAEFETNGNFKYRRIYPMTFQPFLENGFRFGKNIKFNIQINENKIYFSSSYFIKSSVNVDTDNIYKFKESLKEKLIYEYRQNLSYNVNSASKLCKVNLIIES